MLFLESDTSSNPITTDKDDDESNEKSTFPVNRNGNYIIKTSDKRTWLYFKSTIETDSGNDRKNVTKEIEPDNDKTTVAKVDGSDNDEEKITTKSGTTQRFDNEYFARILVGEVVITYLSYNFF